MKVFIHHSDGTYSARPVAEASFAKDLDIVAYIAVNAIEIPDSEWIEYQRFQKEARRWHDRLRELDSAVYARQVPEGA